MILDSVLETVPSNYADHLLTLSPEEQQQYLAWRRSYSPSASAESSSADGVQPTGLLTHHICTQDSEPVFSADLPGRVWSSTLRVWVDGSIAQVQMDTGHQRTDITLEEFSPVEDRAGRPVELRIQDEDDPRRRSWRRDVIKGYSKDARRRLLQECGKLDKRYKPLFVTLTYPDQFPDDPDVWKKNLNAMKERLKRRYPGCAGLWRMELKRRKSGQNEGKIAPHFHLILYPNQPGQGAALLYTSQFLNDFRQWVSSAWFGVVKSGDEKHLRAGTNVIVIYNDKGVMGYISKYIGKVDSEDILEDYPEGIGRCWGRLNADDLPISEVLELLIDVQAALAFMHYFKEKAGIQQDFGFVSLHCFLQPHEFLEQLDQIYHSYCPELDPRVWNYI